MKPQNSVSGCLSVLLVQISRPSCHQSEAAEGVTTSWTQCTAVCLQLGDRYIPHEGGESTLTQTKPGSSLDPTCRPTNAQYRTHAHTRARADSKLRAPLPPPHRQEWIIGVNEGQCGGVKKCGGSQKKTGWRRGTVREALNMWQAGRVSQT